MECKDLGTSVEVVPGARAFEGRLAGVDVVEDAGEGDLVGLGALEEDEAVVEKVVFGSADELLGQSVSGRGKHERLRHVVL